MHLKQTLRRTTATGSWVVLALAGVLLSACGAQELSGDRAVMGKGDQPGKSNEPLQCSPGALSPEQYQKYLDLIRMTQKHLTYSEQEEMARAGASTTAEECQKSCTREAWVNYPQQCPIVKLDNGGCSVECVDGDLTELIDQAISACTTDDPDKFFGQCGRTCRVGSLELPLPYFQLRGSPCFSPVWGRGQTIIKCQPPGFPAEAPSECCGSSKTTYGTVNTQTSGSFSTSYTKCGSGVPDNTVFQP